MRTSLRQALVAALVAMLAATPVGGIAAAGVPVRAAGASAPVAMPATPAGFDVERLMAMVPARIGRWKRVATPIAAPTREDPEVMGVHAEYTAGRQRIALGVSKAASSPPQPADLPSLTRTEAGHVLVYREGREIVVERLRRSDRRAQVTLRRDDGLTVVAEGSGIDPARLKEVARAVGRRGRALAAYFAPSPMRLPTSV